ncbi:hypothetical protein A7D17_03620 [Xanthomonas floridensis]|uniref:Uncharacterized protein n=1 Tax=Xanthomonas floridensis TaxID=1843580 RepID=A0A1A9MAE0_9XANT|nr:hypothetical protein A7D17_03620 [Xanthomonas floridensis]
MMARWVTGGNAAPHRVGAKCSRCLVCECGTHYPGPERTGAWPVGSVLLRRAIGGNARRTAPVRNGRTG